MNQIKRQELEKLQTLDQAKSILDSFTNDDKTYPYEDVRLRRGICKTLAEEYWPLVMLAKTICDVEGLQLLQEANEGPDAQIVLNNRLTWNIQITCSHEDYQRALYREHVQQNNVVFPGERHRNKKGQVVNKPYSAQSMKNDLNLRVKRILDSIQAKEKKYHAHTDTLLVLDSNAKYNYLAQLHTLVVNQLRYRESKYEQIYVVYGSDTKLAKAN